MSCRLALSLLLAISLSALSPVALAQMSKAEAAAEAKAKYGGKVLNVKATGSSNGKNHYQVKLLLKNGKVKTVTISG
ncbi:hypothetical protein [Agaribacterium haliotis]|uniref:hypothetical protein n=1 Tax=Agaribacterium haliotis TaxID=2013869 RepID=UPI000BB579A6|nr:hypothetical protein [Agaribacterium haliotis]